jgi:hypothetical protein
MTIASARPGSRLLSVALLLLACSTDAIAQHGRIQPGTRVRILAPALADTLMVGNVRTLLVGGKIALALVPEASDRTDWILVLGSAISRLEVSRGFPSEAGAGALSGALAGGVASAYLASRTDCSFVCGAVIMLGGLAGGGAGALIGAVWGGYRITGPERWQVHPVPGRDGSR